eukprot:COSAG01_NODE_47976_length_385_cov_0.870629_1_plen_76_part_10
MPPWSKAVPLPHTRSPAPHTPDWSAAQLYLAGVADTSATAGSRPQRSVQCVHVAADAAVACRRCGGGAVCYVVLRG